MHIEIHSCTVSAEMTTKIKQIQETFEKNNPRVEQKFADLVEHV